GERYPEETLDLDVDLALDLNVDSFGWMEIAVALEDRLGVHLSEADIAGIRTIRELLHLSIERREAAPASPHEEPATAADFERRLAPAGALLTVLALTLYALNRVIMRGLFRLRVTGVTKLPEAEPFVITPNHVSDLDGLAIAAALPWSQAKRLCWAGDAVRMFS